MKLKNVIVDVVQPVVTDVDPRPMRKSKSIKTKQMKGTVKRFIPEKGFGFIKQDDSSDEHFFHVSSLVENVIINEGDKVEFQIGSNRQGSCAMKVRKLNNNG